MWAALLDRHGVPFPELMDFGIINCLQLAADSASSNILIYKHLVQSLPMHCLVMFCRCFQHQCGLVIALITTYFGFLTHVFCAAKIFQHADHVKKFRDAVEQILDRDLVIVQGPCSQLHASCNRKLLDLATPRPSCCCHLLDKGCPWEPNEDREMIHFAQIKFPKAWI